MRVGTYNKSKGFENLLWFSEYKIRHNLQLHDGKFLPISGRMDLRSMCENNPVIVEIKQQIEGQLDLHLHRLRYTPLLNGLPIQ